jgi:hypothetical protein
VLVILRWGSLIATTARPKVQIFPEFAVGHGLLQLEHS